MSEPIHNIKRIATDSSMALLSRIFHMAVGYVTSLALARLYDAKNMGTYYIALNLFQTIWTFCCLGLSTGILRFSASLKIEGKAWKLRRLTGTALALVVMLGAVAGLVLWGSGDWLSQHFNSPALLAMLPFIALGLPLALAGALLSEVVRGLGGVRWTVFLQDVLSPGTFLVLILLFAYVGFDFIRAPTALGFSHFCLAVLGLGFLACTREVREFILPASPLTPRKSESSRSSLRELLRYSWPLYLVALLGLYSGGLDSLILGFFTSPEVVAYYGIASRTAALVTFPLLAINAVVPPLFAQLHQRGDLKGLETVSQATARWIYFVALPLALLVILLAPEILGFFGPDFPKAQFAMSVLVAAQVINVGVGSVGFILVMTGQQWAAMVLQISISAGVIPLTALSASYFGLNGVAVTSALGIAGLNILMALTVWRRLNIKAYAQGVRWANIGGILGVGLFFLTTPLMGPLGGALFFILGYLGLTAKIIKEELTGILSGSLSVESVK